MNATVVSQILLLGIISSAYYAILGVSWGVVFATTGTFHFAHGFIYVVGAYTTILFASLIGIPFPAAYIIGIVGAAAVGALIEWGIYNPLRKLGAPSFVLFVSSLGVLILGQYLVYILFTPRPMPILGFDVVVVHLGSVTLNTGHLLIVATSAVALLGYWLFTTKHSRGKALRAVASNPEMAELVGIHRSRMYLLAVALGSALVAIAAVAYNVDKMSLPEMGIAPLFVGFIVAFIGGAGSVRGAIVGGFILGMAQAVASFWLAQKWSVVVIFSVLVLVILVRPRGLLVQEGK